MAIGSDNHSNRDNTSHPTGWKTPQIFYKYGLLCSTHPWLIILIALSVFSFCCYPVLINNSSGFKIYGPSSSSPYSSYQYHNTVPPYAIVQQIIVKSAVIPWKTNLTLMDAIRAPLAQVFPLVEFVSNFQTTEGSKVTSLNDLCLQINEPIASPDNTAANVIPRYTCLLISPANIWKNDINKFNQDATIIKTIFNTKDFGYLDSGNLREILFGVPWMETGIRPFYLRNRQRTITYAITLVFSKHNRQFMDSLASHLGERYPVDPFVVEKNQTTPETYSSSKNSQDLSQRLTHFHFQNEFSLIKSPALIATYIMLFFYIYFSVRKIDLIKRKWALAGSSLLTVILCLLMSFGICSWFDFNPPLNGREILPYLIVIISLENMLVLTQSVVSSPAHLDVKVRVAQGLSRGGQSLVKNLLIELGLLTTGYSTFVPVIQEYCLFGMIGLVSDFFLQFTFFTALLTVDIQRVELNNRNGRKNIRSPIRHSGVNGLSSSNKYLSSNRMSSQNNIFSHSSEPKPAKLPKRLKLVHFWTQTRMVHRFLMVCLVAWILVLLLRSGIVDQISQAGEEVAVKPDSGKAEGEAPSISLSGNDKREGDSGNSVDEEHSYHRIKHLIRRPGGILSPHHWSNLFGFYNISLSGRYISFLPPIHLSIPVDPSSAMKNRHSSDRDHQILTHSLYPGAVQSSYYDQNDDLDELPPGIDRPNWNPRVYFLVLLFSTPTLICIIYISIIMYKCMCSRRYDEWRSSWSTNGDILGLSGDLKGKMDDYMLETILMKREAHQEEIEMIASSDKDPYLAVTSMNGDLSVWDVLSGECHLQVNRSVVKNVVHTHKKSDSRTFKPHHKPTGSFSSDSTYGSCSSTTSGEFIDHTSPDSPSFLPHSSSSETLKTSYNFAPFYSRINSNKDHLTELIDAAFNDTEDIASLEIPANLRRESPLDYQQIWSMEVSERYVLLGCAKGRLEIWDVLSGHNYHHQESESGITVIRTNGDKLVLGRLDGMLEIYSFGRPTERLDHNPHHQHVYTQVHQNMFSTKTTSVSDNLITVSLIRAFRAHSQPISSLQIEASHIITGGADHLVKVFKLENGSCIYNLHGHFGGITCLEVDKTNSNSALSGCKGGQVCLWDLATGTCFFNLEAHRDAAVTSLSATTLYVISAGTDNKINIWDKYSGNLVHSIPNQRSFYVGLIPLTQSILITAKDDHLILWDISEASTLRVISLSSFGDHRRSTIKNLKVASVSRAVVCDYDQNVCIIHFPGLTRKSD